MCHQTILLEPNVPFAVKNPLIRYCTCVDICACVMIVLSPNGVVLAVAIAPYVGLLFVMLSEPISHDSIAVHYYVSQLLICQSRQFHIPQLHLRLLFNYIEIEITREKKLNLIWNSICLKRAFSIYEKKKRNSKRFKCKLNLDANKHCLFY